MSSPITISQPQTSYNLSAPFSYNFPGNGGPILGPPKVSPSGAHVAYFHGHRLVIRETTSTQIYAADVDDDIKEEATSPNLLLLNIKKIINMESVILSVQAHVVNEFDKQGASAKKRKNNMPSENIIMEWDSSFFHTREFDEFGKESLSVIIEDRLAVAVGLNIYIFVLSTNDENVYPSSQSFDDSYDEFSSQNTLKVFDLESSVDTIIQIPPSLLLKTSVQTHVVSTAVQKSLVSTSQSHRQFHGVSHSDRHNKNEHLRNKWNSGDFRKKSPSDQNTFDPVAIVADAGLSICGLQWLQGNTKNGEQVVRVCVYLGEFLSPLSKDIIEEQYSTLCVGSDTNSGNLGNYEGLCTGEKKPTVGSAVAIAICSTEAIEMLIKSPKPGFKVTPIDVSNNLKIRYGHYYNYEPRENEDSLDFEQSLFGILTRESATDTLFLFDLVPTIHSTIPFSAVPESLKSPIQPTNRDLSDICPPVLDAKNVEISPGGEFIAVLDSPVTGYNVFIFSTLTGLLLNIYKGPYRILSPNANVEPATGILWTRIYSNEYLDDDDSFHKLCHKDILLISDKLGLVTALDPLTGKPFLVLNHGTGLVLCGVPKDQNTNMEDGDDDSENMLSHVFVYYEDDSASNNLVEYSLGDEPFDPPLVPTKLIPLSSSATSKEVMDMSVIIMATCYGYVATVVSSLPSTVFLWKLELEDNSLLDLQESQGAFHGKKSKLICVFYHKSFIKSISFRSHIPSNCTPTELQSGSWAPRAQLLIVTQREHRVGIWDSLIHNYSGSSNPINQVVPSTPDLVEFVDLRFQEAEAETIPLNDMNDNIDPQSTPQRHHTLTRENENSMKRLQIPSLFNAIFVRNQLNSNTIGVLAWNRYSFVLFYKVIYDTVNHTSQLNNQTTSYTETSNNRDYLKLLEYPEMYAHHAHQISIEPIQRQKLEDPFEQPPNPEATQTEWWKRKTLSARSFDINAETDDTFYSKKTL